MSRPILAFLLAACAGCGRDGTYPPAETFFGLSTDGRVAPATLSGTGTFADLRTLAPAPALVPYEVNAPFWADGASKTRWIALPPGGSARFASVGEWTFPEGTVFVKHFESAGGSRLETRLLIAGAGGTAHGMSYRWRADGSDADAVTEGGLIGGWYYPGPTDCRECHAGAAGGVLGVNTRQLNRDGVGRENQLLAWGRRGLVEPRVTAADLPGLARLAGMDDRSRGPEDRARSYLDANCAACHRPGGAAADFDARFDTPLRSQNLVGAPSRINLGVDGARLIAPNDPWRSTVLTRLETLEPVKMPPLAHTAIDRRGVALLREWVCSLPGPPVVAPPSLSPSGGEYRVAVRVTIRHGEPDAVIRYTLDGSAPGPSSPVYSVPFDVSRPATVRARAYKRDHTRSIVTQETFVVGE